MFLFYVVITCHPFWGIKMVILFKTCRLTLVFIVGKQSCQGHEMPRILGGGIKLDANVFWIILDGFPL